MPLTLLKTDAKEFLQLNAPFIKELKQTSASLDSIYASLLLLQEESMSTSNEIEALKSCINNLESEIDQYNKEIIKTNFFSNNSFHLMLTNSFLPTASKTDSRLALNDPMASNNDLKITIAFSVERQQEKMEELAKKFPSLKLIFFV